jgi:Aldo/keto reductase family
LYKGLALVGRLNRMSTEHVKTMKQAIDVQLNRPPQSRKRGSFVGGRSPDDRARCACPCTRSKVILPIPGTSSVAHLEENIAAAGLELSQAEYDELSAVNIPPASLRG